MNEFARPFRPEIELLLACARSSLDSAAKERIEHLLERPLDWHYLFSLGQIHGLTPLLYVHLNRWAPASVPAEMRVQFRNHYLKTVRGNLILAHELLRAIDLFATHRIPVVPFKGPILASSVYGNLALREFCDLDFLVREADAPRIRTLLQQEGYRLSLPLAPEQEGPYLRRHSSYGFSHGHRNISLEFHWQILPKREFP